MKPFNILLRTIIEKERTGNEKEIEGRRGILAENGNGIVQLEILRNENSNNPINMYSYGDLFQCQTRDFFRWEKWQTPMIRYFVRITW